MTAKHKNALTPALSRKRERGFQMTAIALSGCASMGDREPKAAMKPVTSYASAKSFAAPNSAWPADAWWTTYGDAQLDTLISEALKGAPSIAIAEARLRRAQASTQQAESLNRPQVSANASATSQKQSKNNGVPPAFVQDGWQDYGRATLDFSWELDFWGKNRAAIAAATSETEAARADAAQARLGGSVVARGTDRAAEEQHRGADGCGPGSRTVDRASDGETLTQLRLAAAARSEPDGPSA